MSQSILLRDHWFSFDLKSSYRILIRVRSQGFVVGLQELNVRILNVNNNTEMVSYRPLGKSAVQTVRFEDILRISKKNDPSIVFPVSWADSGDLAD